MGGVRSITASKAIWEEGFSLTKEIEKAAREGKPYLPLANPVQRFFVNAGYRINSLARWTIRQVSFALRPDQTPLSKVQSSAKAALATPLVFTSFLFSVFLFSVPCYLAASYLSGSKQPLLLPLCLPIESM